MVCLSSTTVVFSADQVVVGVAGGFQTLDFSMLFVFAIALIYFLFSVSIQIACFSLKVSSLIFILVCVCHHRMQDSEYRSNEYNWFDSFPGFNIWRINASGHSWSLRNYSIFTRSPFYCICEKVPELIHWKLIYLRVRNKETLKLSETLKDPWGNCPNTYAHFR